MHESREDALFARALHVGHLLLAYLEGRGERADEEHRESIEDSSELHLDYWYWKIDDGRRGDSTKKREQGWTGEDSKDRRRRQKQQLNQGERERRLSLLERRLNRSEE